MAVQIKGVSSKELTEQRARIITGAQNLLNEHEDDWTDDREAQYNEMLSDASDIKAALERRSALQSSSSRVSQQELPADHPMERPHGMSTQTAFKLAIRGYDRDASGEPKYIEIDAGQRGTKEYCEAFNKALRNGKDSLAPEQMAALQSDDAEQAGYLVASEVFAAGLLKDVDDLLFIRRHARIHTVLEAASLGIRKRTAKMATCNWSPEVVVSTEDSSLKLGKRVLTPHHLTGMIKVSRDLARRSAMSIDMIVREEASRDCGEAMEDGYLTGSGSQQPLGLFTASDDGISTSRDVVTGSATSITADALRDAKYSLKSQYREGPRSATRWLFHRDAIKIISKLKDADNQYLWRPGLTESDPDRLLGMPVDESERVPNTFTNGNYVGMLGNFQYYEIADALNMEVQVLTERYAETNQIGYIFRMKTDGMPTLEEAFARLKCGT